MINLTTVAQTTQWQALPLCTRYLAVVFDDATMKVREGGSWRERTVRWALGVLADGQHEVLGAWLKPKAGLTAWEEVFDDLQVRGVGTIRFVATQGRPEVRAGVRTVQTAATVLPSTGQLIRQSLAEVAPRHRKLVDDALGAIRQAETAQAARAAMTNLAASPWGAAYPGIVERWRDAVEELGPFYALGTRQRRLIRSGDKAAAGLAEALQRAVARHGCFPSGEVAINFVSEVLDRANRGSGSAGRLAGRGSRSRVRPLGETSAPADSH